MTENFIVTSFVLQACISPFRISSTDAEIDISLTWTGFSFKPEISLNSNLRLDLAKHPKRLILVRKKVQRIARKEFEGKIREAVSELISRLYFLSS